MLKGEAFLCQIWHLCGDLKFREERQTWYRGSFGGIVVFDVTQPASLDSCRNWIAELWKYSGRGPIPFILLGNKIDLREQVVNCITKEQSEIFLQKFTSKAVENHFRISYLEINAKTGYNTDRILDLLISSIIDWINELKRKYRS